MRLPDSDRRSPIGVPSLLIFDLDGTLFRSETVTVPAVEICFRERGLPVPPVDQIRSFFGKPTEFFRAWIRGLSEQRGARDLESSISRKELELIPERGELYPRVHEVLSVLKGSGRRMAICSNGTDEYCMTVLGAVGIRGFFEAVSFRGGSGNDKPRMVRDLLERMRSGPAIVIGDRRDDVEAAHENGIYSIAAAYGYGSPDELANADATAQSPLDLLTIIPSLLGDGAGG